MAKMSRKRFQFISYCSSDLEGATVTLSTRDMIIIVTSMFPGTQSGSSGTIRFVDAVEQELNDVSNSTELIDGPEM